ncbi:hypothetical protein ACFLQ6_04115 [Thermoproteota archaeon]
MNRILKLQTNPTFSKLMSLISTCMIYGSLIAPNVVAFLAGWVFLFTKKNR